jgi:hypothetical protein
MSHRGAGILSPCKRGLTAHGRGISRPSHRSRYRCAAINLNVNAGAGECRTSAVSAQVDEAVLSEVLPLIDTALSDLPGFREALERAWAGLRPPATLHDELQERQRQRLVREADQARTRLANAAVLFADGDIDMTGYDFLREKAQGDLLAATAELERLHVVTPIVVLPPLEMVLAAAEQRLDPVRVGRGQYRADITWTPLGEALQVACCRADGEAPRLVA